MMRALITTDAIGGVWTYALDLCHELRPFGFEPLLMVLGPPPTAEQQNQARVLAPLLVCPEQLDWLAEDPAAVRRAAHAVARMAAAEGADIAHLNTPAYAGLADFPCPTLAVAHSCLATWWDAMRPGEPLPASFRWRTSLHGEGLRNASAMATPSRAFGTATRRAYDLRETPQTIHNGRDLGGFGDTFAEAEVDITVLAAGRLWDEAKGMATLDRVATRLSAPFHMAGPLAGPNGAVLSLHSARWLGDLRPEQLAGAMRSKPIFVSAARYEPFGLTVLEAARCGCALVLADTPVFRELWDGAAIFVAPDKESGFVEAIESLLADDTARAIWGERALNHAERYPAAAMAAGTAEAYRRAIQRWMAGLARVA